MLMKLAFLLFFAIFTLSVNAQWYFGDQTAVNLTNSITYDIGTIIQTGSLDPSSTAVSAPPSSLYLSTSGTVYVKQDSGLSTNWLPVGVSTPGTLASINGQTGPAVSIVTGTTGTDFNIVDAANVITLNLPTASATNTGKLSSTDWSTFNNKEPEITATTSADYYRGDKTFQDLGTAVGSVSATFTNKTFDADGTGNSITNIENADIKTGAAIDAAKIADGSVSSAEFQYLSGVTSDIQAQLDGKEPTITTLPIAKGGTNSSTALNNNRVMQSSGGAIVEAAAITSNRALVSDANGIPTESTTTSTELGYVNGVTSAIQTQIDGKEPTITVLPLSKGGTNKNMTAANGGVVYTDTDSQEVTAVGTSNQVLQSNGAAAPTWSNRSVLSKNQGGSDLTLEKLEAPNTLLTETGANTRRLELGNKNILSNPSFEHSTFNTGWTCTGISPVAETTVVIDGVKSMVLAPSATTFECYQDSTTYNAYANGVQFLAMIQARTSATGTSLKLCSRNAGVTSTTNCVNILGSTAGQFNRFKVPFIGSNTSNGIAIVGTTVTGNIYLDDAFMGPVDLKQDVNNVGNWSSYTSTLTNAGNATFSGKWRQVAENIEIHATITIGSTLPTGNISMTIPSGYLIDSSKRSTGNLVGSATAINNFTGATYDGAARQASTTSIDFLGDNGRAFFNATSPLTFSLNDQIVVRASFPVTQFFGSGSVYSSTCGANCVDTFSAKVSSTGVVSGENIDWINGNAVVTSVSTYTMTFNTGIFTVTPNCTVSPVNTAFEFRIDPQSLTSISPRFFINNGVASATDFNIVCQKAGADFTATRTIVGSFSEVQTAPGITKPKTCYYAFGGASATLASPTECTTGTCTEVFDSCGTGSPPSFSSNGVYADMTFSSGTFANSSFMKCDCQAYDTTSLITAECTLRFVSGDQTWSSNASGGAVLNITTYGRTGVDENAYVSISCEGQAP